jgi:hypothetical protein
VQWSFIPVSSILAPLNEQGQIIIDLAVVSALLKLVPSVAEMDVLDELRFLANVEFDLVEHSFVCNVRLARQITRLNLGRKSNCVPCSKALHHKYLRC